MSSHQPEAGTPRGVPDATSPSLVVSGVLMLLAPFFMSNPFFGVSERLWPWELLTRGRPDPLIRAVFALWILTALLSITLGLTRAQRVRSVVLAALAAILLVECTGQGGGFVIDLYNLNQVLPMIGLGAGLLIARQPNTRGLGRLLAGISSVALLWVLASTFIEGDAYVQLTAYWRDIQLALQDWNHEFERPNHIYWTLFPRTFLILAAIAGLVASLGLTHRYFLLGGFLLLVLGIVFPFFVGAIVLRGQGAGMNLLVQQLARTLIPHGFLLWMLGVFVVFDLARGRMRAA